ncbi:MAG: membrane dipeptidase, partial [Candidatus Aminicenantales bacterium]
IKYHHSRDDSDLIRPEMLKKTGDFVLAAVEILANEPGNLIQPMRQETFYLKYQNLINHELPPLDKVIAAHGEAKDSHVDIQLAVIPGQETETPDQARLGILEALLDASESIKKTKGLSLYSPERRVSMTVRQGKTTVVPGVKGLEAFRDDPRWAGVMAKQGVYFATTEASEWLFGQEGLTEEGQKVIRGVTTSGLLLIASGTDAAQARALLEAAKKPLLLITQEVWPDDVLEMVKEKESAVGLLMGAEEEPAVYFKKLDALKEAVESSRVMVVNEQCLWSEKGKMQFLSLFSEIIKAKYERSDLSNIFSGTFLRLLRAVRDEGGRQVVPYIPF